MQQRPNVSNAEGKVMILLWKFYRRSLNSFDAIFRRETSTAPQWKSQKRISRHSAVCLPFIDGNIFFAYGRRSNVFRFRFKVQNEQGILLVVHWKLA